MQFAGSAKPPHMSSTLTATSYLDRLSNEVFDRILSFIPLSVDVKCGGDNPRTLTQTLALMQVSQRFRRVTLQSKFWHNPAFRFESLIPGRRSASSKYALRCARLVNALFQDPDFISCLETKSDWVMTSVPLCSVLIKSVKFFDIACRIFLYVRSLNEAIPHLSPCENVSALVIKSSSRHDKLDLASIAPALPHLKQLTIFLPASLEGSLHQLSELESFNLRAGHLEKEIDNSILPFGSAKSLTHLTLDNIPFSDDFALHKFPNVRHFVTDDISMPIMDDSDGGDRYVEFLRGLPWSLTSFRARFSIYDSDEPEYGLYCLTREVEPDLERNNWHELLSTPCFKTLKNIELFIDWENTAFSVSRDREDSIYEDRCSYVLEVMSMELVCLESIILLSCPLVNVHCLKRWKNLKSLLWVVPSRNCLSENGERDTASVLEQFREFVTKPYVVVRHVERVDEDQEGHRLTESEIAELQEGL
jgi:hypothetical protein